MTTSAIGTDSDDTLDFTTWSQLDNTATSTSIKANGVSNPPCPLGGIGLPDQVMTNSDTNPYITKTNTVQTSRITAGLSTGADGHDAALDADRDAAPTGPDAPPAAPHAHPTAHPATFAWPRPPSHPAAALAASAAPLPPTQPDPALAPVPALPLAKKLPVLATEHATENAQFNSKDETSFEFEFEDYEFDFDIEGLTPAPTLTPAPSPAPTPTHTPTQPFNPAPAPTTPAPTQPFSPANAPAKMPTPAPSTAPAPTPTHTQPFSPGPAPAMIPTPAPAPEPREQELDLRHAGHLGQHLDQDLDLYQNLNPDREQTQVDGMWAQESSIENLSLIEVLGTISMNDMNDICPLYCCLVSNFFLIGIEII